MSPPAVAGFSGRPMPLEARHGRFPGHDDDNPTPPPPGLSGGAVAAIVVVVLAVVLGAAAVGLYFWLRARRRRREQEEGSSGTVQVVIRGRHSRLPSMRRPQGRTPRTVLPVYSKFATPKGSARDPPRAPHPHPHPLPHPPSTHSVAFTSVIASTAPLSDGYATPNSLSTARGSSVARSQGFAAIDERGGR